MNIIALSRKHGIFLLFSSTVDVYDTYATLTKIETGVIKKPSVFVVSKIAKALNIAIEELIK